jgi:hypothetical protein
MLHESARFRNTLVGCSLKVIFADFVLLQFYTTKLRSELLEKLILMSSASPEDISFLDYFQPFARMIVDRSVYVLLLRN